MYKTQHIIKKRMKLIQFGDPHFPELMTTTAEDLYHSITQEDFVELIHAFKMRESQIMKVAETAKDFKFEWHNLNSINACIRFHTHHRPDTPGHGDQAAAPESEMYNILEKTLLTENHKIVSPVQNILPISYDITQF